MPSWEFLGEENDRALTAYVQSLGGKDADYRVGRQNHWKKLALAAYESGPDTNVEWLHAHVPAGLADDAQPVPRHRGRPGPRQEASTRSSASTATGRWATARARPPGTAPPRRRR